MAHPPVTAARRPRPVAARWLVGYLAGGGVLSGWYLLTGQGLPCPFHRLTGWWCPLCGGTRMGAALLSGNVPAAFAFNPMAFAALVVAALVAVWWLVGARRPVGPTGGPAAGSLRNRLPRPCRGWSAGRWWAVAGAVAVVFTVARNLGHPFVGPTW